MNIRLALKLLIIFKMASPVINKENDDFKYERMHHFGLGLRIIPNSFFRRAFEHPDPLPPEVPKTPTPLVMETIQQGKRKKGDRSIFSRYFDIAAKHAGQHNYYEMNTDCLISYILAETEGGIPILLRGGVGYRHFVIVVRAKAEKPLKGQIKVYCSGKKDPYHEEIKDPVLREGAIEAITSKKFLNIFNF